MKTLNFSQLGHSYLRYANPISEQKFDEAVELCRGKSLSRVLDVGTGNGYLLNKFVKGACESGVGVDLSDSSSKDSVEPLDEVTFITQDATKFIETQNDRSFDLTMCIGSCHALGGYRKTLAHLKRVTKVGGLLIIGDGYWVKDPSKDYLNFLGSSVDDLNSHAENLKTAEGLQLTPTWARTASKDEWDHYEWNYSAGIEDFFLEHPDHPQKDDFLKKISNWRRGVWEWGRNTLGFGLYVFRK